MNRTATRLYAYQLSPGMKLENGEVLRHVAYLSDGRSVYIETEARSATLVSWGRIHVLTEVTA